MGTTVELLAALNEVNLEELTTGAVATNAPEYAASQREQMKKGQTRNDGMKIRPKYRSMKYARMKEKFNPKAGTAPDNVDLYFTGDFSKGIKMSVSGQDIMEESTDSKSNPLTEKYGQTIWGLNTEHIEPLLLTKIFPVFKRSIEKITGLQFTGGESDAPMGRVR